MKKKTLLTLACLFAALSLLAKDAPPRPFFDYSKIKGLGSFRWPYPYPVYGDIDSMVFLSSAPKKEPKIKEDSKIKTVLKFNEKGDVDVVSIFLNDTLLHNTKVDYKYDEKGFPSESVSTITEGNNTYTQKITYRYNDQGKIANLTAYYGGGGRIERRINYIYDDNGQLIEEEAVSYYLYKKMTYNYDEKGNTTELTRYDDPKSKNFEEKIVYKYNKKGKLTEVNYLTSEGDIYLNCKLKCDKRGNVTDETLYEKGEFTESTKCLMKSTKCLIIYRK
jgi:hypothetical protein